MADTDETRSNTGSQPNLESRPPEQDKDARNMAMLAHLLAIVLSFLGPLIIWLIKKDQSKYVEDQGREALNFNILMAILYCVSLVLICIVIGGVLLPLVWIANIVFAILAGVAASRGEWYRYPINWRIIK